MLRKGFVLAVAAFCLNMGSATAIDSPYFCTPNGTCVLHSEQIANSSASNWYMNYMFNKGVSTKTVRMWFYRLSPNPGYIKSDPVSGVPLQGQQPRYQETHDGGLQYSRGYCQSKGSNMYAICEMSYY